jgi:uncharacterized lipoprotein YmbA
MIMRTMKKTPGLMVPFVLVTLAGCFSLSRQSPTLERYVLGGTPTTESAASSRYPGGLTVGLRRLDLAAYLATPSIVVRRGAQQIVTSEFHRWGEDPAAGIARAVARYLAAGAPVQAVDIAPWPVRSRYDFLIQLHVSRFEGAAPEGATASEGKAHVAVTWEIIRQEDGTVLARGAIDHREPGWKVGDYAGLVTLLDRGLNALALDLATCLGSLAPVAQRATGSVEAIPRPPAAACAPRSKP